MEAATDVHCNKRQRVDSAGELPTNVVANPPRIVHAKNFQEHDTPAYYTFLLLKLESK